MNHETVKHIEALDSGELLIAIEGQGNSGYQYVYREAAGVYWSPSLCGFKSTPMKEWSCSQWYAHIVAVVRQGLGVELTLADHVTWSNIAEEDRVKIRNGSNA
jgi:hypothetical protein